MTDNRALIFINLLNGVPPEQVARDFRVSQEDAMKTFNFVLRKIKNYCFTRARGFTSPNDARKEVQAYPIIVASTVKEAQKYRLTCLSVVPKLNLDKAPQYRDIQTEIVTPDNVMAVARNLNT